MSQNIEQTFMQLARDWSRITEKANADCPMPRQADLISFACLLLAVEWDDYLTDTVITIILENERLAYSRWSIPVYGNLEALVWKLCPKDMPDKPARSAAVAELIRMFNVQGSSIRGWAMEMGWMIRPWLPVDEVVPLLLSNVANTLGFVREAFALARALCKSDEKLEDFIRKQEPDIFYWEQFENRIKTFREEGFGMSQLRYFVAENECRKIIERAVFLPEEGE